MLTLFPEESIFPAGFTYEECFLCKEEEEALIHAIRGLELQQFIFQGYEAKRKVASFGWDWNFENRTLNKGAAIPQAFLPLLEKVSHHLGIAAGKIAELLVTEYEKGTVINWHRDAPPFDTIIGLSLLSDCTFRLRPQLKEQQTRGAIRSFTVRRRSLYVMAGEARSEWQHSIAPVKGLRYSVTLRTLK
ncbi:MAG TPA: alpha-ketoglutarate-dependent dioxygenase AlkB [Flavisolibacter sp.]|nr:alpha-ketoglutarate-dependent dioxygenase AlkB [Flavisolibacter sp.]